MNQSLPTELDPKDIACFTDLKGRVFTLRLPWSKFEALCEELNLDLSPGNIEQELATVLDSYDLQYNVVSFLVREQLEQHGLTRESWMDDFFGCVLTDDDDIATPLEASGEALMQVALGFIQNRTKRKAIRSRLRLLQQSQNAMHEKYAAESASVSPDQLADLMMMPLTKGLTIEERLEQARRKSLDSASSENSSGTSPADSASTPATTPSDS